MLCRWSRHLKKKIIFISTYLSEQCSTVTQKHTGCDSGRWAALDPSAVRGSDYQGLNSCLRDSDCLQSPSGTAVSSHLFSFIPSITLSSCLHSRTLGSVQSQRNVYDVCGQQKKIFQNSAPLPSHVFLVNIPLPASLYRANACACLRKYKVNQSTLQFLCEGTLKSLKWSCSNVLNEQGHANPSNPQYYM